MKPGICYCLNASRCFSFILFCWPSQTYHSLLLHSWLWLWLCGRPLLQVQLSVAYLCTMWPSNKFICYPFVQFIELSGVSRPARPQIGAVRWEMERELSGPPSLPHHCRKGISIRPDRLRRGYRWLIETLPRLSMAKGIWTQTEVLLFNMKPVRSLIARTSQACYVVYVQINFKKVSLASLLYLGFISLLKSEISSSII